MDFLLGVTDWNLVSEVGLPPDGEWCFVVFGDSARGYSWTIGGYSTETGNFWGNMGYGGMVLEGKDAVAWKSWDKVDFFAEPKKKDSNSKYLLSDIVIDGIEPTQEYKALLEKEKRGEITAQEIAEIVRRSHVIKPKDGDEDAGQSN